MAVPNRRTLLVAVLVAAALGFAGGWWVRARSAPTVEERTREAAAHLRKSLEALTR
jgi:hypothetical protein